MGPAGAQICGGLLADISLADSLCVTDRDVFDLFRGSDFVTLLFEFDQVELNTSETTLPPVTPSGFSCSPWWS